MTFATTFFTGSLRYIRKQCDVRQFHSFFVSHVVFIELKMNILLTFHKSIAEKQNLHNLNMHHSSALQQYCIAEVAELFFTESFSRQCILLGMKNTKASDRLMLTLKVLVKRTLSQGLFFQ